MPRSTCGDLMEHDEHVRLVNDGRRHCMARRSNVEQDHELYATLSSDENVCNILVFM